VLVLLAVLVLLSVLKRLPGTRQRVAP
jgi:hypothetical protein